MRRAQNDKAARQTDKSAPRSKFDLRCSKTISCNDWNSGDRATRVLFLEDPGGVSATSAWSASSVPLNGVGSGASAGWLRCVSMAFLYRCGFGGRAVVTTCVPSPAPLVAAVRFRVAWSQRWRQQPLVSAPGRFGTATANRRAHAPLHLKNSYSTLGFREAPPYISTCIPSSTTRLGGRPKKAVARCAFRARTAKSRARQRP